MVIAECLNCSEVGTQGREKHPYLFSTMGNFVPLWVFIFFPSHHTFNVLFGRLWSVSTLPVFKQNSPQPSGFSFLYSSLPAWVGLCTCTRRQSCTWLYMLSRQSRPSNESRPWVHFVRGTALQTHPETHLGGNEQIIFTPSNSNPGKKSLPVY